jgi:hypothetical protein
MRQIIEVAGDMGQKLRDRSPTQGVKRSSDVLQQAALEDMKFSIRGMPARPD